MNEYKAPNYTPTLYSAAGWDFGSGHALLVGTVVRLGAGDTQWTAIAFNPDGGVILVNDSGRTRTLQPDHDWTKVHVVADTPEAQEKIAAQRKAYAEKYALRSVQRELEGLAEVGKRTVKQPGESNWEPDGDDWPHIHAAARVANLIQWATKDLDLPAGEYLDFLLDFVLTRICYWSPSHSTSLMTRECAVEEIGFWVKLLSRIRESQYALTHNDEH